VKTVKIAELRNRLSYYLRRVQRGESILVCDRDRVIPSSSLARVEAEIPAGTPDHVVRTVTENSRTLKFSSQGFEAE
jgi:prevent-host-death family protein